MPLSTLTATFLLCMLELTRGEPIEGIVRRQGRLYYR